MLRKAGFKKKYLKKPETALPIYQYLLANPDFEQDMLTKDTDPAEEKKQVSFDHHNSFDVGGSHEGSTLVHKVGQSVRETIAK